MIKAEFHHFFGLFAEAQQAGLLAATEHRLYESGALVFEEGDTSDALYLVLDGEVEIRKRTAAGDVEILTRLRGDECFGEMGVLDGCERSASAYAVSDTRLARIPGEIVLSALEHEPSTTLIRMFRSVSDRLRRTDTDYVSETFRRGRFLQIRELSASLLRYFENPMTAIEALGASDLSDLSPRDVGLLAVQQAYRMRRSVEVLAHVGDAEWSVQREACSVGEILVALESRNMPYLAAKGVALEVKGGDDPIDVDRELLLIVLQILVNNAVEGHARVLRVQTYWQPSCTEFTVTDDGRGVPERIQDTLFAPFVTEGKPAALGLGLAVAKSIVAAHGGHITYQAGEGGGATFIVNIPSGSEV
jgi:signal transduction histidine kinase